jgi:polyferredoxin
MVKPIYNRKDWILCRCQKCSKLNYCEPHGTTAACSCSVKWTEHKNIPYEERDISGCWYVGKKKGGKT